MIVVLGRVICLIVKKCVGLPGLITTSRVVLVFEVRSQG